jgi:hypothetical protein
MNSRSHVGFWLILFLVGILVTPYIWRADTMRGKLVTDVTSIKRVLGDKAGGMVVQVATSIYDATVGASGLGQSMHDMQHSRADYELANRVGSKVMEGAARQADAYMQSLAMELYAVILRMCLVACWLVMLLPVAAAVVIDGLSARAKKFETLGFQNPTAFSMAVHTAIFLAVLPLLYIVAPIPITPLFMPYWAVAAALPVSFAITHMQPVLTR